MYRNYSNRIEKINEVLVALSEQQFTDKGNWKDVPKKPERPIDPNTDKPKGVDRSAPPSQRTPEDNDFLTKQREYNLQNQQGRQNFNPNAPRQLFTPSWNVKGEERRQQTRAYLNYIRADPERLARFRAQSNDRETRPVASFAGRPESEVQARLAAYNRGAALTRAGRIGMHSPGLVPGLADVADASYDATMDKLGLANLIKGQKSPGQIRAENLKQRQDLENERRGKVGPSTPGNQNSSDGYRLRRKNPATSPGFDPNASTPEGTYYSGPNAGQSSNTASSLVQSSVSQISRDMGRVRRGSAFA